jgi:hypothetical protein
MLWCNGCDLLLQLCDPSSLQALETLVRQLKAQLGGLPSHVERQHSRLHFLEVPLVDGLGALSRALATPRAHALVVHVEGVAQGPRLDACLVLFIRRVFEEVDRAAQSRDVVSSACQVKSGGCSSILCCAVLCCMVLCCDVVYCAVLCSHTETYACHCLLQ